MPKTRFPLAPLQQIRPMIETARLAARWNSRSVGEIPLVSTAVGGQGCAMPLDFQWDKNKARTNLAKHGVSFDEATTVFADPFSLTIPDPAHSQVEDRLIVLGHSHQRKLLVVVHTERGDSIRIISARRASRRERTTYEESN